MSYLLTIYHAMTCFQVGKKAIVLGWGIYDEHGAYPDGLQQVEVEILDNSVCARLYGPIINQVDLICF